VVATGAEAIPPSHLEQAYKDAIAVQGIVRWSTCGMGGQIPCQEFDDPAAAYSTYIGSAGQGCAATVWQPWSFTGTPVNGVRAIEFFGVYWYRRAIPPGLDNGPCEISQGVHVVIPLAWYCPDRFTWVMDDWFEDANGNPVTSNYASRTIACRKPVPPRTACTTNPDVPGYMQGNPVSCADFVKHQKEVDIPQVVPRGLSFTRAYRSDFGLWSHNFSVNVTRTGPTLSNPDCLWMRFSGGTPPGESMYCFRLLNVATPTMVYKDWNDSILDFRDTGQGFKPGVGVPHSISTSGTSGLANVYTPTNALERFDSNGRLVERWFASGGKHTLTYSDASTPSTIAPGPGYLISIADSFSRSLALRYDPQKGRLTKVIDPAGQEYTYGYDSAERLSSVIGPDLNERKYLYNEAGQMAGTSYLLALTGIIDESGKRYATYGYDAAGRATSTEHAGGVDRYTFTPPNTATTPLGETITYTSEVRGRLMVPTRIDRCRPGASCPEYSNRFSYDTAGNLRSALDSRSQSMCRQVNSRDLESVRIEGSLYSLYGCPADLAATTLPTPAAGTSITYRKVSTQWHPDWRLQTKVAEPGRITTWVYNGQADPFNGNSIASCAPAGATLPDGKPIAVLCKKVEQATTDVTGSAGFGAALQTGVANRIWTYTYNANGQILTENGPRTDVTDVTTFEYHSTTSFSGTGAAAVGTTAGDLWKVTNALGKVTQYTKYNKHGQVKETIDPNGVVTSYDYDLRQRLTRMTVGGQSTTYEYWPTGLLKKIVAPDSSFVSYEYDDAHRLKAIADNRGNRIEYTLDDAGNRTAEKVKDPGAVLRRQLTRVPDAFGRIQQVTGRE
jgi:YD repeat-containing protein